jgi:hypothetical protein
MIGVDEDGEGAGSGDAGLPAVGADRFYQGRIVRLHPGARSGILRTGNGREVPFDGEHLRIVGTARGFEALAAGQRVGFDLGRSSRGLCVTTIRVYETDPTGVP